jgi:SAM-dependent methyltransferase
MSHDPTGTIDERATDDETLARLEREAAFHDQTAEDETRRPAEKFYAVTRSSHDFWLETIFNNASGRRVLEYGCGTGANTIDLARCGASVTGIDISPVAVGIARERVVAAGFAERVELHVMNAEALDLPDDTFDMVCGCSVIHHLDLDACYREISRVLRPGGFAIFDEPLGHNPLINWYRNRTPSLRTEDEHPMMVEDYEKARAYFGRVDVRYYHITSLAAVLARNTPLFDPLYAATDWLDRVLMRAIPPLRRWAWRSIVIMTK